MHGPALFSGSSMPRAGGVAGVFSSFVAFVPVIANVSFARFSEFRARAASSSAYRDLHAVPPYRHVVQHGDLIGPRQVEPREKTRRAMNVF
jgi:hypothetical protein